mmetsp:Transcript_16583/g.58910  ORF Transcript_16583/g.58910 Transcript_16583/m.58910 type:complete len:243 (-) Transcript_16583:626-1354(-)
MDFVASAALNRHGADEGEAEPSRELLEEETVFMLELPTLSVGDSLQRAIQLNLRSDPDVHKPTGVAQACGKAQLLMGSGGERSRPACGNEGWVKGKATTAFPIIGWLPAATKASLKADVIAGLTVGVMVVPQSMAYASIAGLELVYGLYASTIPAIAYASIGGGGPPAAPPPGGGPAAPQTVDGQLYDTYTIVNSNREATSPRLKMYDAKGAELASSCSSDLCSIYFTTTRRAAASPAVWRR